MIGLESFKALVKQYWILAGVVAGFGLGGYLLFDGVQAVTDEQSENAVVESKIENAESKLPLQSLWNAKVERDSQDLKKELRQSEARHKDEMNEQAKRYENLVNKLQNDLKQARKEQKDINKRLDEKLSQTTGGLQNMIASIKNNKAKAMQQKVADAKTYIHESTAEYRVVYDNEEELTAITLGNVVDRFNTPENTIPANSFVKAVVLNGVDASTSEKAANNPKPILMEIVDVADLPNGFGSNIKGCRINGIVEAEKSSERVGIRLKDLTCIDQDTKQITVSEAKGYVSGEDGRFGLRGTLVRRDGYLMRNAFIGGALGGVSKAISQLAAPATSFNPFTGNINNGRSSLGILQQAGGEGASTGLDRIAKYYVDEADELSPVIQVASGRVVDVVFTASTNFTEVSKSKLPKGNSNNVTKAMPRRMNVNLQSKQMNKKILEGEQFAQKILGERK